MKTFFAWIAAGEPYDPDTHSREDLKIFHLKIEEKEGSFPQATLLIKSERNNFEEKKEALVSFDKKVLFRGALLKTPLKIMDSLWELKLIAQPNNYEANLHQLCNALKAKGLWDPLFVAENNQNKPYEILEARSDLFYWSRTTGEVKPSNIFKGSQCASFKDSIFQDDFKVTLKQRPIQTIQLELSAEWIQDCEGSHDIGHLIKFKFPEGMISSLTGESFKKGWWKKGEKIGRSGYTIERSSLQQISPPYTGKLNLYPHVSIPLWEENAPHSNPYYLKRTWFRVQELRLNWRYRQKRREIAHIRLDQDLQSLNIPYKTKTFKIRLQNIAINEEIPNWLPEHGYSRKFHARHKGRVYECFTSHISKTHFEEDKWLRLASPPPPTLKDSSFFITERGERAVTHAIEIAKAHLAYSSRAIEIKFTAPFKDVSTLTCDHQVTLKDPRLPKGIAIGKVKKLCLYKDGQKGTAWGEVTLACAIGKDNPPREIAAYQNSYGAEGYMEENYLFMAEREFTTPSHIFYKGWQNQTPIHGLVNPYRLTSEDIVEEIRVINPPAIQNQKLADVQFAGRKAVLKKLNDLKTTIQIRLKDMKSWGVLVHHIKIPITQNYSPPEQINLKG